MNLMCLISKSFLAAKRKFNANMQICLVQFNLLECKEANRGRVTPSTEFTCYHVAYLIGLSHLCALLVYQCLIVPTNENVQMKQASAATFQNLELARNCYRSLHLQFVFNLILLKVIVILQYLLVINLI